MEDEVDEKFYLDNAKTRNLIRQLDYKPTNEIKLNQLGNFEKLANPSKKFNDPQTGRVLDAEGICQALDTMQGGNRQPKILQVGNVNPSGKGMNGNVFNQDGLSPTITTNKGEGLKILEPTEPDTIIKEFDIPKEILNDNERQRRVYNTRGISPTVLARTDSSKILEPKEKFGRMGRQAVETYNEKKPKYGSTINPFNKTVDNSENSPTLTTRPEGFKTAILPVTNDFRIRKLTPLECWRLMGFTDEQFQKAQDAGVSNSQLYKQAGNSIVVDVLYYLFKSLFIDKPKYKIQISNEEQLLGQMNISDYL